MLIYWDFHAQPSLGFTENGLKKRKYPVSRGQRRMGRLVRDYRKATVTQITTRYNQGMQNTISEMYNHVIYNMSNPEADGLQQQKTTPHHTGASPVS